MTTLTELTALKEKHTIIGVYFKSENCGVCSALLPRIQELFDRKAIHLEVVDLPASPELMGTEMVMNVPVLKIFHNKKEVFKEGAYMNLKKVSQLLFELEKVKNSTASGNFF